MKVVVGTCRSWYLPQTAKAFAERDALAAFYNSDSNRNGIRPELYHRCWPYHLAMKPFYASRSQIWSERATYACIPLWGHWIRNQRLPRADVVQGISGFCEELFDSADKSGAMKVVDLPNSHPASLCGIWQRECDLWCPGTRLPIPRRVFRRMTREIARADVVLCPSNFVRDSAVHHGIRESKCFINPFGVNTSVFTPRVSVPENPRFIAVGTICVRKGYQYLFRAFERVKRELPAAELVVVGDYKVDFADERPRWEGTFEHHRSLPHAELSKQLQAATAFVFPSLEEGFARVIPEAMACGLPIIATHESGATTLVSDGNEGVIVKPRDPVGTAEAMIHVARNRDLNRRMGEAAHRAGAKRNTWQDYGDRLLAEYKRRCSR